MRWRVSLVMCSDGSEPDGAWAEGFIVDDSREGAADLIAKVNHEQGALPVPGEVYKIEAVCYPRYKQVRPDNSVDDWSG
jgi:hypothetical protein